MNINFDNELQKVQIGIDTIADLIVKSSPINSASLKLAAFNIGAIRLHLDKRFAEMSDSERSGRRDKPDFMEPNASAQIALSVSDDALRVTAPNKSQPESVAPCQNIECPNYRFMITFSHCLTRNIDNLQTCVDYKKA
jgi:hypothetical protein